MHNFPDVNVTVDMFPDTLIIFEKIRNILPVMIDDANRALAYQKNLNKSISMYELQETMIVVYDNILTTLDALPEAGSLLWAKANTFLTVSMTNSTELTEANYNDVWSGIIFDHGDSELWFFPAAGASILALVVMSLIKGRPRDKFEWTIIGARSAFGTATCLLALLDMGGGNLPITASNMPSGSKIWTLVLGPTQWPLIILALVLVTLKAIEHIIAYVANRTYMSFENIALFQPPARSRTHRYQRNARNDSGLLGLNDYLSYSYTDQKTAEPSYDDPFDPYVELEDSKVSRQSSQSDTVEGDGVDRTLHGDEYPLIPKANAPDSY